MTSHSPWLPRIVSWHARLSLARKLTFLGVLTSIVSLVVAMTAVLAWDLSSARTRLVRDTGMLADVIGSNSNAATSRPRASARASAGHASASGNALSAASDPPGRSGASRSVPRGGRFRLQRLGLGAL